MASYLIVYASDEGQTGKIAGYIEQVLRNLGNEVSVFNASEATERVSFEDIDAVLIGASIHVSKHQAAIYGFVEERLDAIEAIPNAFFQVSLSSASEEGREQAAGYVEAFIEATNWQPDQIGLFGGALRYSEYGFLKRTMMKQISKKTIEELPDPDEYGDYEFTDWDEVAAFATDFDSFVDQLS